ncbi:MAG: UDP-N-acetylmuramate dehydrogenase, partial [Pyrinomonadaceae bacterium]
VFILGGGSNIVVSDAGFDGLVIQVALMGKTAAHQGEFAAVTAQAGEDWDEFAEFCVSQNLAGIECLSGIPGSVGGTPVQNVGAYGQEVSESITSVRCLDRESNEIVELSGTECGFSYRTSIFNSTAQGRYVVLSVTYRLVAGGEPKIVYKDIKEFFAGRQPSLQATRDAVLEIRRAKSMVIDPADPNSLSAGSFFKNPIVPNGKYEKIAAASGSGVPKFPIDADSVKIPAAWLIEESGFDKGFRLGNAGISANHALAIVNLGRATAADIISLKDVIQAGVEKKFGIVLRPEPVFVGF